jgi:hypothetical protein
MLRSLLACLAALVLVPVALADGPQVSPGTSDGGAGLTSPAGDARYATFSTGPTTVLATIATANGMITNWRILPGSWGIPNVAFDGSRSGLAADGKTLVLSRSRSYTCTPKGCSPLVKQSRFMVFTPKTLHVRSLITLHGDFSFDALSPQGRFLYLIQHVSAANVNRYLVRAYDLRGRALRPGAIADRTQRGWVMQGTPATRATSAGGRFVYTLYYSPYNYPFVHALDTVAGTAHCIGIPWGPQGDQSVLGVLTLSADGRTLTIGSRSGRTFFTVDTHSYRISKPSTPAGGGFRWWWLALSLGFVVAVGVAFARRPWRRALRTVATAALK